MELFLNKVKITDTEEKYIDYIKKLFEEKNENGALFAGFPFSTEEDNCVIRGMLVCQYGIFAFYEPEDDISKYKRFFFRELSKSDKVLEMMDCQLNEYIFYHKFNSPFSIPDESQKNLTDQEIRTIVSVFQNVYGLSKANKRLISSPKTIGSLIVKRNQNEANLDENQFNLVYNEENDNHNMRVVGLAGCGKTILLSQKMAYLHFRQPEYKMAYVFYTKSLKQSIDGFFTKFYEQCSHTSNANYDNIDIMHGWGSSAYEGLYSKVCRRIGVSNTSYSDFSDFDALCREMIKFIEGDANNNLKEKIQVYDYILIDEAQDFSLSFFKLARMCLKPSGKLIYAYDELQDLNKKSKKMPSIREIFDDAPCKTINLANCYRTPNEIIVTAHALGLGTYHYNDKNEIEMINVIQDKSVWPAIGYHNRNGTIKSGEIVSFYRDKVIDNPLGDEAIVCKSFNSSYEQDQFVYKEILDLVRTQDVLPEDILIIDLDSRNINEHFANMYIAYDNYLSEEKLDETDARPFDIKLINKESGYAFKTIGKVTYTTIFRAKGNEENIVFVINSNDSDEILSYNRNRLFTAMTRAKFKVYICGIGDQFINSIAKEIESVKENNYELVFKYPTKEEIARCQRKVFADNKLTGDVDDLLNKIENNSSSYSTEDFFKLLLTKLTDTEKEMILKKIRENKDE